MPPPAFRSARPRGEEEGLGPPAEDAVGSPGEPSTDRAPRGRSVGLHRDIEPEISFVTYRTVEWLERAHGQTDGGLVLAAVDLSLESLRDDPRFGDILEKMGLAGDGRTPSD